MSRLLLLYGTNTGNTLFTAEIIAKTFAKHHLILPIKNVAQAKPEDILGRELLIMGSPTWGDVVKGKSKEGQLQDEMAHFLSTIKQFKLKGRPMAIFGLGDSQYRYFCGAGVQLKKFAQEVEAHIISDPLYIDGYPQNQPVVIEQWAESVINDWRKLSKSDSKP